MLIDFVWGKNRRIFLKKVALGQELGIAAHIRISEGSVFFEKDGLKNQARHFYLNHILSKPEFAGLQNCRITCVTLTNFF
jgi:hypothetical protein